MSRTAGARVGMQALTIATQGSTMMRIADSTSVSGSTCKLLPSLSAKPNPTEANVHDMSNGSNVWTAVTRTMPATHTLVVTNKYHSQASRGKYGGQGKPIRFFHLQTPDDGQRDAKDSGIQEQRRDGAAIEYRCCRKTNAARDRLVPDVAKGSALTEAQGEDADTLANDKRAKEGASVAELLDRENAQVEEQDGDFGGYEGSSEEDSELRRRQLRSMLAKTTV
ncbi:MAG: hypothetical protein LQ352_006947 [Teloschistes flavicans]|nr:MAG: hypothetical protein LQ352_006947 [Teloschistes flavicans]